LRTKEGGKSTAAWTKLGITMTSRNRICAVVLVCLSLFVEASYAGNDVLGELQLEGASKVAKTSGVWIDGQYLGYLDELKGSKKILLLPGTHKLAVRQNGYVDFTRDVELHPGEKQLVTVTMAKDTRFVMPAVTAEIKMSVNPDRAAVFLDGQFVGHAAEFGGIAKSLIVAPGHRKISITLPGYQTFSTEFDLAPNQKFVLKTDLVKSGNPQMEEPK
jgi:PEGA domain